MSDRKLLAGRLVWFEHVSKDARKAQVFYGEMFGWRVKPFPMGDVAHRAGVTGHLAAGDASRAGEFGAAAPTAGCAAVAGGISTGLAIRPCDCFRVTRSKYPMMGRNAGAGRFAMTSS